MANPRSFGPPKKRLDHSATAPLLKDLYSDPTDRLSSTFPGSSRVVTGKDWPAAICTSKRNGMKQKNEQSGLKKAPSVGQFNSVWLQDKTKSFFSSKFWIEFVFNFFWRLRTSGEFFGPILLKYSEAVNWFIMWKVITKLVLLTNQEKPWPYFFSTITCGRQPLSNDPRFCQ